VDCGIGWEEYDLQVQGGDDTSARTASDQCWGAKRQTHRQLSHALLEDIASLSFRSNRFCTQPNSHIDGPPSVAIHHGSHPRGLKLGSSDRLIDHLVDRLIDERTDEEKGDI